MAKKITHPITMKYASRYYYTDVMPYEVIEQLTDKCIVVREMDAELTEQARKDLRDSFSPGGFVGHFDNDAQDWTFKSNENKPLIKIRLHKDGYWYAANDRGTSFALREKPYKYYDYNF